MSSALLDVLAERQRQIEAEGWSLLHDDEHSRGELAAAGAAYAAYAEDLQADRRILDAGPPAFWPFGTAWWKPHADSRRNLIKAAALLLAEIERLDRRENKSEKAVRFVEWHSIEDISEADKYSGEYLLYGPSLIDLDFNPTGIVEGHWQDDEGWVGAVWSGCHDCWDARIVSPTHFARKPGL